MIAAGILPVGENSVIKYELIGMNKMKSFEEVFEDKTKYGTKIKTNEYQQEGKYLIVDQGQEQVAGYTNLEKGVFEEVPAIVFGDHTRVIKYVEEPFFLGADGVKVLKCRLPNANYKYLYYTLLNAKIPNTGYNRHFKWLKEIKIAYPNTEKQTEIVCILDKVSKIIGFRQRQLKKLDELVKSRFIELFGDPEQNPKGWPVVNITEIIGGKVSNGFFAKREAYRDDGNVQVLGVANIVNRMYSSIENLPRTNATPVDEEKYAVKYGDMLFCRSSLVAEGIGKASIVPKDAPRNVLFECHVIRLPLDLQKCIPEFVQALSTTDFFRRQIIAQSKTATMTTIGQDGILKSMIILPPIEQQREFLRFVEQTDKSKIVIQQALDKAQLLFDSLMQKYFG